MTIYNYYYSVANKFPVSNYDYDCQKCHNQCDHLFDLFTYAHNQSFQKVKKLTTLL